MDEFFAGFILPIASSARPTRDGRVNVDFVEHQLLVIFVVSVVAILAAGEVGRRFAGRAKSGRHGNNISTLEAAVLGLLALMISFTFAMALSRYEARRVAILNEANAISTTALRARLLPAPHNKEVLGLLRDYVQIRLGTMAHIDSSQEMNAETAKASNIQEALWQQAKAVAGKDNAMVPTGIFIQSLNEMIDDQEKYLVETLHRLPNIVLFTLYGVAAVSIAFAGYAAGLDAQRSRVPVAIMGILICLVILLIQDIDRPTSGFIIVSQQPMLDAAASLSRMAE
jgi:hypothetical protein